MYLRQYKADGTVFWNHVFVAALRNSEDKIINYVGIQHPLDKVKRSRIWSSGVLDIYPSGTSRIESTHRTWARSHTT